MNKKTDVLVIGSGMAGLMAALAAASSQCKTAVISEGMGNLSISGGCIDFLGYDQTGNLLADPWSGLDGLDAEHPYSLLGKENIKKAFDVLTDCLKGQGMNMRVASDANGKPANICLPTIVGTLKPTYYYLDDIDSSLLENAKKILVIGIHGFRDCKPRLIIEQLRRYPGWEDKDYGTLILPPPFNEKGRSLNALDIARVADRIKGKAWLLESLKGKGKDYDLALLPPILGAKATSVCRLEAPESLGCPCLELQCIPPGVGGLRLRHALVERLHELGVEFYENAQVTGSRVVDGKCVEIKVAASGHEVGHEASAYVLATGGIISGGIILGEGNARESILGLPLDVPANVDEWTSPEIFGQHFLAKLGVKVDAEMRPLALMDGKKVENVFFAGHTLGGYDYASEKSGYGVAVATGWKAGEMAAQTVGCHAGATGTDGADK